MMRKLLLAAVALLVIALALESLGEELDARAYPPLGRLVDVGGYKLHLDCRGTGSPTVILESGSLTPSPAWDLVQAETARFTRVCAYDRAGYGWSEPAKSPRTAHAVSQDLATLLQNAGEHGPYVLVAHSLGGLYARAFTAEHPTDVAGLVLVDSRGEDVTAALAEVGPDIQINPAVAHLLPSLMRLGIVRLMVEISGLKAVIGNDSASFERLRPEAWDAVQALMLRPRLADAGLAEMESVTAVETAVRQAGPLGDTPLVVLAHGRGMFTPAQEQVWLEHQQRMASLSTKSRFQVAETSGHYIQADQPELIIQAIRDVLGRN